MTTVDLDRMTSRELFELAWLRQEAEKRETWDRAARLAEMLDRPALGHYKRHLPAVTA